MKKTSPERMLFSITFLNGFWEGWERVLGSFWERFGRDFEPLGQFFDVFVELILNFKYTLKVENQFHKKKEVPKEDLEGFGEDWEGFWRAFGEGLETLGAPWAAFWVCVWCLY